MCNSGQLLVFPAPVSSSVLWLGWARSLRPFSTLGFYASIWWLIKVTREGERFGRTTMNFILEWLDLRFF
jgi:hypothetical protein